MKRIIACLILLLMGLGAQAQTDTMFYFMNDKLEPCEKNDAYYYRIFWQEGIYYSVRDYYMVTSSLKEAGMYSDSNLTYKSGMFEQYETDKSLTTKGAYGQGKKIGVWRTYYKSGAIADSSYYKNDIRCKYHFGWDEDGYLTDSAVLDMEGNGYGYGLYPNGRKESYGQVKGGEKRDSIWTYWHPNGQIRVLARFEKDSVLEITCFDSLGHAKTKDCIANKLPEFPGGDGARLVFMAKNLHYPIYARENNITGRVIVRFMVNEDGTLSDIEAIKNPGGGLAEEALRMVKQMPKWKPGIVMAKTVKVYFTLPIMFSLK